MQEYQKTGRIGQSALRASMDRKTAAWYVKEATRPGERKEPRGWRTREDPLAAAWPVVLRWLEATPELEAKALYEHLLETQPEAMQGASLRTFYRRVSEWKRQSGPPLEVFFPQAREPGRCIQIDWTHAGELGVTIAGEPFAHLLCHAVLPYSNWEWAVPCRSESLLSLRVGLQAALWRLGGRPERVQTDQSSAATHVLNRNTGQRSFNGRYLELCEHLGLEPCTINRACPNENGDVESANGHLKRRLRAHLNLRGSRDFADQDGYAAFVAKVCDGANGLRRQKVAQEVECLHALPPARYPEAESVVARVSSYATARIRGCAYSVPARLIGAMVEAEISETTVLIRHGRQEVARYAREPGVQPRIDYRHVIDSLIRKPGAFARYLYREELFPRPVFRHAWDRLRADDEQRADGRYVQLLYLAARHGEQAVAEAVAHRLRANRTPLPEAIEQDVRTAPEPVVSAVVPFTPELRGYDALLGEVAP